MSDLLQLLDAYFLAFVALLEDFTGNTVRHLAFLPARPEPASVLVVVAELAFAPDVLAGHVGSRAAPHGVEAGPEGVHAVARELNILSELSSSDEPRTPWSLCFVSEGFGTALTFFW